MADEMLKGWTVDKRVPLALVLGLGVQFVALIIWGATMDTRVRHLETELAARSPIVERFLRIEADFNSQRMVIDNRLTRIEDKLDRLFELSRSADVFPPRP